MKLVKVVNKDKKYLASNGKEYTQCNYYIVLDNNQWLAVKPCFKNEYAKFDTICEIIINSK